LFNVTFDAQDPRRLGRFWSHVLGYSVIEERPELVRLRGDPSAPDLLFLRVADPAPGKPRLHLDLAAGDVATEIRRLAALGAALADGGSPDQPRWREANNIKWVVLEDPEGNAFCLGARP
jgi:catechol 2,3-dioxygenase-like lactoylglutathione lyase family enzyme